MKKFNQAKAFKDIHTHIGKALDCYYAIIANDMAADTDIEDAFKRIAINHAKVLHIFTQYLRFITPDDEVCQKAITHQFGEGTLEPLLAALKFGHGEYEKHKS